MLRQLVFAALMRLIFTCIHRACTRIIHRIPLVGWVLLIGHETELARIIVALLVSVAFVAFHLGIKPFKRCGNDAVSHDMPPIRAHR